jgi:hypothetical protein
MAKTHGARQQKKVAKQKAKRSSKGSKLAKQSSKDPTVRLERADKWPVVQALVADEIWDEGVGYAMIARQESEGRVAWGAYLVDTLCLGVKNAFWDVGTRADLNFLVEQMEFTQQMRLVSPADLVKLVQGAVEFAHSFGFRPHPDYRHASRLLEGIDTSTCAEEFTFGSEGAPFYRQGPYESDARAEAIIERVREAGGSYVAGGSILGPHEFGRVDEFNPLEEDDDTDSQSEWR